MSGPAVEPFWRAPRRLRELLDAGQITATQYALLHYVGEAEGDRRPFVTTQAQLAAILGVSKKTVSRALDELAELGLTEDDRRAGVKRLGLWLGPAALVDDGRPRTDLGHGRPR